MEAKHTSRTMGQGQLYCSGSRPVHLIPGTSLNPVVRHHRPVAKALSESRSGEIKKKIKSGLESVYPGIKNYAYPLKVLVQFWALKAAPDGRRYLATTSDRIFRLSNYDEGLFRYWAHCRSRDYFVDGGPEAEDAFCQGELAWTQEAWQRSTKDHPELNHALHFALPVVEPSSTSAQHSQSQTVVGLLEIVVIPNYNNNSGYAEAGEEVTKIREALEVAKALSESRNGEIKMKIKSGLESVYPGTKSYAYPLKVLVQFWALKAAPDGRRYLATTSDRIFRLSNYDEGLFRYWAHCRSRDYFVDGSPKAEDAFCQSEPAWTQEAWQRSTKDHPELNHALHFALPVVEPSSTSVQHSQSLSVVGLLEIVVMPNYNNSGYAEVEEEVTKILEALEGKNVLVIGTTSEVAFLDSVGICAAFSYTYRVPTLKTEDAKKVLHQLNVFSEDDIDAAAEALNDIPIKKLYMVVEMAAQGEQGGGAEAIYSGKEKIKISHFYKCLNDIV